MIYFHLVIVAILYIHCECWVLQFEECMFLHEVFKYDWSKLLEYIITQ